MLTVVRLKDKPLLALILVATVPIRVPIAFLMGDQMTVLLGIDDQVSYDALGRRPLTGRGYSFPENRYPFEPPTHG